MTAVVPDLLVSFEFWHHSNRGRASALSALTTTDNAWSLLLSLALTTSPPPPRLVPDSDDGSICMPFRLGQSLSVALVAMRYGIGRWGEQFHTVCLKGGFCRKTT